MPETPTKTEVEKRQAEAVWVLGEYTKRQVDEDEMPALSVIKDALQKGIPASELARMTPGELAQKLQAVTREKKVMSKGTTRYSGKERERSEEITDALVRQIHAACVRVVSDNRDVPSFGKIRFALLKGVPSAILLHGCTDGELSTHMQRASKNVAEPVSSPNLTLIDGEYDLAKKICTDYGMNELAESIGNRTTITRDKYYSYLTYLTMTIKVKAVEFSAVAKVLDGLAAQESTAARIRSWAEEKKIAPRDIPTEGQLRMVRLLSLDEQQIIGITRQQVKQLIDGHYDTVLGQLLQTGTPDEKLYAEAFGLRREFWNKFGAKRKLDMPNITDYFVALSLGNPKETVLHMTAGQVRKIINRCQKAAYLGMSMDEVTAKEADGSLEREYVERLGQNVRTERVSVLKSIGDMLQRDVSVIAQIPLSELQLVQEHLSGTNPLLHCNHLEEFLEATGFYSRIDIRKDLLDGTSILYDRGSKGVNMTDIESIHYQSKNEFFVKVRDLARGKYSTDDEGYITYAKSSKRAEPRKCFVIPSINVRMSIVIDDLKTIGNSSATKSAPIDPQYVHPIDSREWRSTIEKKSYFEISDRCRIVDKGVHNYGADEY